jgi:ArsR family transcriptional regulator
LAPKVAVRDTDVVEVFKAFADPVRWAIVVEMSHVDEFPASALEEVVPVSKPTISYHIKVLYHANLIEVRKEGRNFYYRLRRDVLRRALAEADRQLGLAPAKRRTRTA